MYNHAPPGYKCPFCKLVQGIENQDSLLKGSDIVTRTEDTTTFIAARKWPNNPGHVLVIPNVHYENFYALPETLGSKILALSRKIALAMKAEYRCDGVMLRQHNEPAGDQHIWHYHLNIIPRYHHDDHYNTHKELFPADDRADYARMLKNWFGKVEP